MVNDYCNHKCKSCDIWKNKIRTNLPLESIVSLFQHVTDVHDVSLTGGEPFLRKDLSEVVQAVTSSNPNLKMLFINTNSTIPERIPKVMNSIKGPQAYISVSLEGVREVHDYLRGVKSYDQAIKALSFNGRYKKVISTTVQAENCNEESLQHIKRIAGETGSDFTFRLASKALYYNNLDSELPSLSREQRNYLIKFMEDNPNPFFDIQADFMRTGTIPLMIRGKEVVCKAGKAFIFVKADGNIAPCIYSSRNMGNVKTGIVEVNDLGKYEPCPCCTECTVYPMLNYKPHEN